MERCAGYGGSSRGDSGAGPRKPRPGRAESAERRLDEQRGCRGGRTETHAGANAEPGGKAGSRAFADRVQERDSNAVAHADADGGPEAESEPQPDTEEPAEADGKADAESDAKKERRTNADGDAKAAKGQDRFGTETPSEKKESNASSNQSSDKREHRKRVGEL